MSLRDDLADALCIGAYASGSWEERVDDLMPVIDAALADRVKAAKVEARREEREAWSGWLDSWVSAAQVDPPTVEAIANWLRAEQPPFGKSAGGAS